MDQNPVTPKEKKTPPARKAKPAAAEDSPIDQGVLRALFNHFADGVFVIDAGGELTFYSPACRKITGWSAEEIPSAPWPIAQLLRCVLEDPQPLIDFSKSFDRPQVREHFIHARNGRPTWVEVSYSPVLGDQGQLAYVLGIMRDISQQRQLEDQLRLTRKLATLGELTSAMAHEIKNPLGIIVSASEILANPKRPEEQKQQAIGFIREEARRLDDRMKVFLKFSRPKPPEFKSQDVHRVLEQTICAYQTLARSGLSIETHFAQNLPRVLIDADQMQQVFLNLILNADQAMPAGGVIRITTRPVGHEEVEIEIKDDGLGLPEGDQSRLFEPFFSTKSKGTGLGLSIVLQIVIAHMGHIVAGNHPEGGAAFVVTLPAAQTPEDPAGTCSSF